MTNALKILGRFLLGNWERLLFGVVGFACLIFSLNLLFADKIASGSAVFAIGFLSFLYSNLARFKRFKGLGFEAELWEDKQKEAAGLIDRLKNVVSIYTREIVMSNVMRGRWGSSTDWQSQWGLYDELVGQHDILGQKIDFSELKRKIDGIFLFDICSPLSASIQKSISDGKEEAQKIIATKFGSPITDADGYRVDREKLNLATFSNHGFFERSERENIAQDILDQAKAADDVLQTNFAVTVVFDPDVMQKLQFVSKLHERRPLHINEELLALAN